MTVRTERPRHRSSRIPAALVPALLLAGCSGSSSDPASQQTPDIYTVERQAMRIRVTESAELQAAKETRIRSDIEGSTTILFLVPEGQVVEKGQRLVELDVSDLKERRATQAISVEKAYAALVNARQNLEILQKELDSLEGAARSGLEIARIDLEKFLGSPSVADLVEGDGDELRTRPAAALTEVATGGAPAGEDPDAAIGFENQVRGTNRDMVDALRSLVENNSAYAALPDRVVTLLGSKLAADRGEGALEEILDRDMGELGQQVLEQVDQITLARQELALAVDTYEASKELRRDEYITENDLRKDRLAMQRQQSGVALAWQKLDILIGYTLRKTYIDLKLKLDNAELELEKVQASNAARRTREEAELSSAQSEHDLAKERLENFDRQIATAVLIAPTPGLVVYATMDSRGRETVEEGTEIRERQTILTLPDVTRMIAELKVQEADVDKVTRGQLATIEVDAFPGKVFTGRVDRVSPIADSGSRWSNSNLKVYKTWVTLEHDNTDGALKPNMAARVTILVGEVPDALPVPITAVRRQGKVNYVWKLTADGPTATQVKVGRSTNEEVEVLDGVAPGERIFRAPPPGAVAPTFEQPESEVEEPELAPGSGTAAGVAADGMDAERAALEQKLEGLTRDSFLAEVKQRLPQFAAELDEGGMRAMFTNPEIRAAIQGDPVLAAMSAKLMERGAGRRPGGGPGGAPDGERRPGGGGRPASDGGSGGDR